MYRIAVFNITNSRSTGNVAKSIEKKAEKELGSETFYFWSYKTSNNKENNEFFIREKKHRPFLDRVFFKLIGRYLSRSIFGDGFTYKLRTKIIVRKIKKINPDLVHIHNLHGEFYHLPTLINYLKSSSIPVVFTLHDCWLMTGCCPHFIESNCVKYIDKECDKCSFINKYPLQYRDIAHKVFVKKKELFKDFGNCYFVCCSNYLESVLKQSHLKTKKSMVITNGINTDLFNFKDSKVIKKTIEKYNIPNANYVIAVADTWSPMKGSNFIAALASDLQRLGVLVLVVGKQSKMLKGSNIMTIDYIDQPSDLACLYGGAIAFVNPTLEDTYPSTDLESICCGTPVVVFDTGGCKETILPLTGFVVKRGDYAMFLEKTIYIINNPLEFDKKTISRLGVSRFDSDACFGAYCNLYKKLLKK